MISLLLLVINREIVVYGEIVEKYYCWLVIYLLLLVISILNSIVANTINTIPINRENHHPTSN